MTNVNIQIKKSDVVSKIDNRLYSSFIEHMGRAVYTGIYEPSHPTADSDGFRGDVLELIKPLGVTNIRYPGGNFVSGYNWEDGIGDKANRPVRAELAWQAIETNEVGTDEFMKYLDKAGSSAMLAVNLGTGTPQSAANMLEYCNFEGGTHYSELRKSNGREKPYNVKLWCLGNEMDGPWQICGKTADEYGRIANETAKMMKWLDPSVELVACGSSYRTMPTYGEWERTVLRHCYENVDYLSLHQYYQNNDGDIPSFLSNNLDMQDFIREVARICDEIKAEKKSSKDVRLSFDEWNVWYHFRKDCAEPEKWIKARPVEEEVYDFADALLVGSMLTTLINNSDVVKIACLAQLVNTIAPIMTQPGAGAWAQTIYYPFLYSSKYGRGTALRFSLECPSYDCAARKDVPFVDCAAVLDESETGLTLFLVNKNDSVNLEACVALDGFSCGRVAEAVTLSGFPFGETNSAKRSPVMPKPLSGADAHGEKITFTLPAASWNMIRVSLK